MPRPHETYLPEDRKPGTKLDEAIAEAVKDVEMPDLKAIICAFMNIAGGAKGVAKMLRREYKDAKPGSMIRSMILQMILQGTRSLSVKEASRDVNLISDDDIERELRTIVSGAANAGKFAGVAPGIQP